MKKMIARGLSHFWRTGNGEQARQDTFPLGFFRSSTDSASRDGPYGQTKYQMLHKLYNHPTNRYTTKINLMRVKDGPNVALRAVMAP